MIRFLKGILAISVFSFLGPTLDAGPIITQTFSGALPATITGTLPNQDTALLQQFTLGVNSGLTVTTTSYASGGFQPNLFLFDMNGSFVTAGTPFGAIDPTTGIIGDMRLSTSSLPAGMYTLAVTDFLLNQSLTATNLSDGFTANFGSGTTFVDATGNTRTGNFAFTISAAPGDTAIPEPAAVWLIAPALAAIGVRARRRLT